MGFFSFNLSISHRPQPNTFRFVSFRFVAEIRSVGGSPGDKAPRSLAKFLDRNKNHGRDIFFNAMISGEISSRPKTRPISPKWWVLVRGNPRKFQGKLGWWNIIWYFLEGGGGACMVLMMLVLMMLFADMQSVSNRLQVYVAGIFWGLSCCWHHTGRTFYMRSYLTRFIEVM